MNNNDLKLGTDTNKEKSSKSFQMPPPPKSSPPVKNFYKAYDKQGFTKENKGDDKDTENDNGTVAAVQKPTATVKAPTPVQKTSAPAKAPTPVQKTIAPAKAPTPVQKTAAPDKAPTPVQKTTAPAKAPTPVQKTTAPAKAPTPVQKTASPAKAPTPVQKTIAPAKAPTPVQKTIAPAKAPTPVQKTAAPDKATADVQKTTAPAEATADVQKTSQIRITPSSPKTEEAPQKTHRTIGFSEADYFDYAGFHRRAPKGASSLKRIIGRCAIVLASALLFAVIALFGLCFTVAKGPSETVRNLLVLSAKQASATKWVPGIFLSDDVINEILAGSEKVETDVMSIEDYYSAGDTETISKDEWENAKDGMLFKTLKGSSYTAYMLIVKDPSRIFVGTSSDNYSESEKGKNIFDASAKRDAVAAINGGEFPDSGGIGTGSHPIGLTYSGGECVWNDGTKRTFIGFDNNNRLHAIEGMTKAEADSLGIRDAVSFQTGNVLISSDGENVTFYYAEGNNGTAQRTAIGQRADGAVILLVTDGRTASSLGATHNDVIDIMVEHGAVTAAMLDGGSSAMMYYENYFEKYSYDYDSLDQYQKKGLVNKYKAFTTPRNMPTFFMVERDSEGGNENAE